MLRIPPVQRQSLVDTVVERIREVIEQGRVAAGDRLPTEAELGAQRGVSRAVVREAVSQLESLGLLSVQRGRGMFVGNWSGVAGCVKLLRSALALSPKELARFTEFRNAIACYAARRAAERATAEDVPALQQMCDDMNRLGRDDREAMHLDFQFHRRLMALTGNELMCSVLEVIQECALATLVQTTPKPRDREQSHRRHQAIVASIRAGDADAAAKAVQAHREHSVRQLQAIERQRQRTRA
jgi:GntR family transcriptional repressor for pyruvate dehydrogenase complex